MGISNEDSLFVSFSQCLVAPFYDDPTYMMLRRLNSHLNLCAVLVHCDLGHGNLC